MYLLIHCKYTDESHFIQTLDRNGTFATVRILTNYRSRFFYLCTFTLVSWSLLLITLISRILRNSNFWVIGKLTRQSCTISGVKFKWSRVKVDGMHCKMYIAYLQLFQLLIIIFNLNVIYSLLQTMLFKETVMFSFGQIIIFAIKSYFYNNVRKLIRSLSIKYRLINNDVPCFLNFDDA